MKPVRFRKWRKLLGPHSMWIHFSFSVGRRGFITVRGRKEYKQNFHIFHPASFLPTAQSFCLVASTRNSLKVQCDQISTVALILKEKGHFYLKVWPILILKSQFCYIQWHSCSCLGNPCICTKPVWRQILLYVLEILKAQREVKCSQKCSEWAIRMNTNGQETLKPFISFRI